MPSRSRAVGSNLERQKEQKRLWELNLKAREWQKWEEVWNRKNGEKRNTCKLERRIANLSNNYLFRRSPNLLRGSRDANSPARFQSHLYQKLFNKYVHSHLQVHRCSFNTTNSQLQSQSWAFQQKADVQSPR